MAGPIPFLASSHYAGELNPRPPLKQSTFPQVAQSDLLKT